MKTQIIEFLDRKLEYSLAGLRIFLLTLMIVILLIALNIAIHFHWVIYTILSIMVMILTTAEIILVKRFIFLRNIMNQFKLIETLQDSLNFIKNNKKIQELDSLGELLFILSTESQLSEGFFYRRDLPLLRTVIDFLDKHELVWRLKGSILEKAIIGELAEYNDIDILVVKENHKEERDRVVNMLFKSIYFGFEELKPFFANFITKSSVSGQMYVNTLIDSNFTIEYEKTKIHLCFEAID